MAESATVHHAAPMSHQNDGSGQLLILDRFPDDGFDLFQLCGFQGRAGLFRFLSGGSDCRCRQEHSCCKEKNRGVAKISQSPSGVTMSIHSAIYSGA